MAAVRSCSTVYTTVFVAIVMLGGAFYYKQFIFCEGRGLYDLTIDMGGALYPGNGRKQEWGLAMCWVMIYCRKVEEEFVRTLVSENVNITPSHERLLLAKVLIRTNQRRGGAHLSNCDGYSRRPVVPQSDRSLYSGQPASYSPQVGTTQLTGDWRS